MQLAFSKNEVDKGCVIYNLNFIKWGEKKYTLWKSIGIINLSAVLIRLIVKLLNDQLMTIDKCAQCFSVLKLIRVVGTNEKDKTRRTIT